MDYPFISLGPTLRYVVLAFLIVFAVALLGFVVGLAALPGQLAKRRHHPQTEAINICGWVGLPTGILWAVAMVWAFVRPKSQLAADGTSSPATAKLAQQVDALEKTVAAMEATRSALKTGVQQ